MWQGRLPPTCLHVCTTVQQVGASCASTGGGVSWMLKDPFVVRGLTRNTAHVKQALLYQERKHETILQREKIQKQRAKERQPIYDTTFSLHQVLWRWVAHWTLLCEISEKILPWTPQRGTFALLLLLFVSLVCPDIIRACSPARFLLCCCVLFIRYNEYHTSKYH